MKLTLDMYQTLGIAVLMLYLGGWMRKHIRFLETFCIPSPVVGGLCYAILMCILHVTGVLDLSYDDTLKNVCMVIFFTSVGFQANVKVLKQGGVSFFIFLGVVVALVFAQNGVALGLAKLIGAEYVELLDDITPRLLNEAREGDVVLYMGAGNIEKEAERFRKMQKPLDK